MVAARNAARLACTQATVKAIAVIVSVNSASCKESNTRTRNKKKD
jgi:hypothetical protein